jgi:hypothetical protein
MLALTRKTRRIYFKHGSFDSDDEILAGVYYRSRQQRAVGNVEQPIQK